MTFYFSTSILINAKVECDSFWLHYNLFFLYTLGIVLVNGEYYNAKKRKKKKKQHPLTQNSCDWLVLVMASYFPCGNLWHLLAAKNDWVRFCCIILFFFVSINFAMQKDMWFFHALTHQVLFLLSKVLSLVWCRWTCLLSCVDIIYKLQSGVILLVISYIYIFLCFECVILITLEDLNSLGHLFQPWLQIK